MLYQPAIKEGLPARRDGFLTGLFAETVTSVRASRRVASETAALQVNRTQIPRLAQQIQALILTISYTQGQTPKRVKQFGHRNSGSLKNAYLQACDLSGCRV